jgi:L-2-hydroxyglutarate oxidase LhgO
VRDFEIVVIGGGLIGLACASALAALGHAVLVVERHGRLGQETSSRNSGVVHAGLYYPPGSLKMQLCLRGRELLEEGAIRGDFPVARVGKLVVASATSERPALEALAQNAAACGVVVEWIEGHRVPELEPNLRVEAALLSPSTGIIDPYELLSFLRRRALASGVTFALGTAVVGLLPRGSTGWMVTTRGTDGTLANASCEWVINAAGLEADRVAELAGLDVDAEGLRQYPCKGDYFELSSRAPCRVSRLVYPLPHGAGLGIHLTLDLAGGVRAGPDAAYVDSFDLSVDEGKRTLFAEAIARYLPGVRPEDLTPAFAGIRPKLAMPGQAFRDFAVRHEAVAGLPGLINLLGIDSPGLTASLAIAERVAQIIQQAG